MQLGKVTGSVQATIKHDVFAGEKLMLVQPVDPKGKSTGSALIALDRVQAGPGDWVLYVDEGNSARTILDNSKAPVRTVIMAIVDSVDVEV